MLDPALLRGRLAETATRLKDTRGTDVPVARLDAIEAERKQLQTRTQELQNLRNTRSKAIGQAKAKGEDTAVLMAEVAGIGDELKSSEARLGTLQDEFAAIALSLPNVPHDSVPAGRDETGNVEIKRWGEMPTFTVGAKDHVELGARKGWLDGDTAAKVAGARFTVLRGELARLHRALAQFMLDLHTQQHGYLEVNVPLLVLSDAMQGTGQLPKFEEDLFATNTGDVRRYLIPTSEVPLTNLVRDEIVEDARCRCA